MSRSVKLSDPLVLDARITGELVQRSIAGQIEFWARLGRSIEPLLRGDEALALCRNAVTRPLSQCLGSVDTDAGRQRMGAFSTASHFHILKRTQPGQVCWSGWTKTAEGPSGDS